MKGSQTRVQRRRHVGRVATGLVAALMGCSGSTDAPDRGSPPAVPPPSSPAAGEVRETVLVEGVPQVVSATAYAADSGFPLAFRTVVPTDMVVDVIGSGEGDVVRFEAAFGGRPVPEAALHFFVMPEGIGESEVRSRVDALVRSLGATRRTRQVPIWAVEAYDAMTSTPAFLAVGVHRERWFYFLASYPEEFGDGMAPRIQMILRNWVWSDDQSTLMPS